MNCIKSVNIPQACHQSWQEMTTVSEGRYCQSCCKTVVDFTAMNNEEILANLSAKNNICGRFGSSQINKLNNLLLTENKNVFSWKRLAAGLTLVGLLSVNSSEAKTKPGMIQMNSGFRSRNNQFKTDSVRNVIIKGKVISTDDGSPMPGVSIRIKGINTGTITDANGNFVIHSPDSDQTITVSFIGYIPQEISLNGNIDKLSNLQIREAPSMTGEIVIVKHAFINRIYYKFIKRPIRKVFG
ncbi:MAG: carboxypeptidase-like regulatory domain-containing protein [Mucilaginibacter sp.]